MTLSVCMRCYGWCCLCCLNIAVTACVVGISYETLKFLKKADDGHVQETSMMVVGDLSKTVGRQLLLNAIIHMVSKAGILCLIKIFN